MSWRLFFVSIFLFMLVGPLAQADVQVYSSVDRNEMAVGDTFTLTVSVSSDQSLSLREPKLPDLTQFEIVNTWQGSSTQSTFENGKFRVNQTRKFNYMLVPKAKGRLNLGAVTVEVDGRRFATKPIPLNVKSPSAIANRAQPKAQRPRGNSQDPFSQMDDLFSQLLQRRPRPGYKSKPINPNEAFFIQVEVDKTDVYAGEQVTASFYIYSRGAIRDIDTLKYPTLKGFWKEDIEVATRLNFRTEVVNGIAYQKALLASYALFPIKPGKITIDSYKAKCTVVMRSNFGFGQPYQYTKSSRPVAVSVREVPRQGQPPEYNGAVGQFNMSAQLESKSVPVNQPITLRVRVSGKGNAKLIDMPPLDLPESVEIYDTKTDAKFNKDGSSYKEFETLLIPREEGEVVIPNVKFSAFDPETGRFYSRSSSELKFSVVASDDPQMIPSSPLAAGAAGSSEEGAPKGPVLPQLALQWKAGSGPGQGFNVLIWVIVYLGIFGFIGYRIVVEFEIGRRKKDLDRMVKDRFRGINKKIDEGDWRAVGIESTNLVYFLLGEISGEGGASSEIDKLLMKASPSVRRQVGESLKKLMHQFEALGFAPESVVGDLKNKKNLKKSVDELEKVISKALKLGLGQDLEVSS
jgi:hypothetical protein